MRIVCLSSGGIDSSLMMYLLKNREHDIMPLFIDYGQLAYSKEWAACQRVCKYLGLEAQKIDVRGFGQRIQSGITDSSLDIMKRAFLPNRNLLLLALGASFGFQNSTYIVAIGLLSNSVFPDQTPEFIRLIQVAIGASLDADVRIMTPLISLDKTDVLKLAIKHSFPLDLTYYCHSGKDTPCGRCISCTEHDAARRLLGDGTNPSN